MKTIFLFLLLSNGLLYLWQSYFVSPEKSALPALRGSVPELVLLEETGTTAQSKLAPQTVSPAELDENTPTVKADTAFIGNSAAFVLEKDSCYTVGPFIDDESLNKALTFFAKNNREYKQRTFTEPELFGYNILIPAFTTRAQAVAAVDELVKKGVKDYYIMTEPKYKNAISLGLFREHRFALQQLDDLQKKGVQAEMQTRYFDRSRHWLDYTDTDGSFDAIALSRLSPESDVQRLSRACA